tara:strand:+ start:104 stop:280 length:177 start_codon:yes stop_codon:yes gene_type:complete
LTIFFANGVKILDTHVERYKQGWVDFNFCETENKGSVVRLVAKKHSIVNKNIHINKNI